MRLLLFCALLMGATYHGRAQALLFQQDFSTSTTINAYIDAANPGTTKFTEIDVTSGTNASTTMAIVNNTLEFYRPAGSSGHGRFTRAIDFSTTPQSLYIQFSFEASIAPNNLSAPSQSIATFYVGTNGAGNGFKNDGSNPDLNETFAKLSFNIVRAGNNFYWQLRDIASNVDLGTFVGQHTITIILNQSDYRYTYLNPNGVGGSSTIAAKKWEAWVDGTQLFDEMSAIAPSVQLKRFKFKFEGGICVVRLDDLLFRDISGALPLFTTNFRASVNGSTVDLSWQAKNVAAGSLLAVERSSDGLEYVAIQHIAYEPDRTNYCHTDRAPLPGTNYYRLRQYNPDGTTTPSRPVAVNIIANAPGMTILDNPGNGLVIRLKAENLAEATFQLATLTGLTLPCHMSETPDGQVTLQPQHPLSSGVYLLTATARTARLTRRVLVH